MYTNRGILQLMTTGNIAHNYSLVQKHLTAMEKGELEISDALLTDLVRWEQDMHAYIVNMTEKLGRTNVCNDSMKL